jgi:hypothetical protein
MRNFVGRRLLNSFTRSFAGMTNILEINAVILGIAQDDISAPRRLAGAEARPTDLHLHGMEMAAAARTV